MLAALVLDGCSKPPPPNPDWILRGQLIFVSDDLVGERPALPREAFRLFLPYIAGDLYGSPTTGDFINATIGSDYRFEIDLNRSHPALLASLQPTELSVSYLHVEPAAARLARLAPLVLQADGIEPVGRASWMDGDSRRPLLLLFLDRPANITGQTTVAGRPLRYAIEATSPGYVWVVLQTRTDGDVYVATARPARLLLAVAPLAEARADTPAP